MSAPVLLYSGRFCAHSREILHGMGPSVRSAVRTVDVDPILDRMPGDVHSVPALLLPDSQGRYRPVYGDELRAVLMRLEAENAAASGDASEPEMFAFCEPDDFCNVLDDQSLAEPSNARYAAANDDVHISFRPTAEEPREAASKEELEREIERRNEEIRRIFPAGGARA